MIFFQKTNLSRNLKSRKTAPTGPAFRRDKLAKGVGAVPFLERNTRQFGAKFARQKTESIGQGVRG